MIKTCFIKRYSVNDNIPIYYIAILHAKGIGITSFNSIQLLLVSAIIILIIILMALQARINLKISC